MNSRKQFVSILVFSGLFMAFSGFSMTFDVFGEIKKGGVDCIPDAKTTYVTCCYKETDTKTGQTTATYCTDCFKKGDGNLECPYNYEKVEAAGIQTPSTNKLPKGKGIGDVLTSDNLNIKSDEDNKNEKNDVNVNVVKNFDSTKKNKNSDVSIKSKIISKQGITQSETTEKVISGDEINNDADNNKIQNQEQKDDLEE